MSDSSEPIRNELRHFVGNVKTISTKYGEILKLGFNAEHLAALKAAMNDRGWVNVNLKKSQGGKYYMEIDMWGRETGAAMAEGYPVQDEAGKIAADADTGDDLPF